MSDSKYAVFSQKAVGMCTDYVCVFSNLASAMEHTKLKAAERDEVFIVAKVVAAVRPLARTTTLIPLENLNF